MKRKLSLPSFSRSEVRGTLDVFRRPWNVALIGTNPMADDPSSQHVADQFVVSAVPGKKRGTGTAATIHLKETVILHSRDLDFVLDHAGGPEHPHYIGFLGLA